MPALKADIDEIDTDRPNGTLGYAVIAASVSVVVVLLALSVDKMGASSSAAPSHVTAAAQSETVR
ncbi:hypothetical protein DL1_01210 [Thioclava dalianensis]|uniref:Uncharacterized protein n=1 Tax=Thioclava dalianensis TaxID=1185766 RepID=A0A074TJJ0_9RHOB|nr:hypothetical protein [Thioclava dalianensis]KEP71779.1 hypothetical protein DL1_01210 [Thioclava dalianensis]SFN41949.1 hypothetical protein SAMN05216224_105144 [Thioclava dalianensis]